MKTVYINENSIEKLMEHKEKLKNEVSSSIIDAVERGKTVYRRNDAFPETLDDDFLEGIIMDAFNKSKEELINLKNIETNNTKLETILSELERKVQEIEEQVRPQLEKICYNIIVSMFNVPENSIMMDMKLVTDINYTEFNGASVDRGDKMIDSEIGADIKGLRGEIGKRSIITALCIGAGMHYSIDIKKYISDIYDINPQLGVLYKQIIAINNYLNFTTDSYNIDGVDKKQLGLVEITVREDESMVQLKSRALIFPVLLCETIRGMMEIFAAHGLPDDMEIAQLILSRTDYLKAEPMYMMTGEALWERIMPEDIETELIPYYFKRLCCLNVNKFNMVVKELLAGGEKSNKYKDKLMKLAANDMEDDSNANFEKENDEKSIITDDYIREEEL